MGKGRDKKRRNARRGVRTGKFVMIENQLDRSLPIDCLNLDLGARSSYGTMVTDVQLRELQPFVDAGSIKLSTVGR